LPIKHTQPIPDLSRIATDVRHALAELFPPEVRLTMEPGRAIVGDCGILVASVIGKAKRGHENWLYLDAGVFNALMETIEGFSYELCTERPGPTKVFTVAGPSCDSVDVMFRDLPLPELEVGERVYLLNAGAYTLSYASHFNGFGPPAVHFLEGGDPAAYAPRSAAGPCRRPSLWPRRRRRYGKCAESRSAQNCAALVAMRARWTSWRVWSRCGRRCRRVRNCPRCNVRNTQGVSVRTVAVRGTFLSKAISPK